MAADQTIKAELKRLDRRYTDDGDKIWVERKAPQVSEKDREWWDLFALCEVRYYHDEENDSYDTSLRINSPFLRQLLQDVIGEYDGETFDPDGAIEIDLPARCLFFYRNELEAEGVKRFEPDSPGLAHVHLLMGWINDTFEDAIRAYNRATKAGAGVINYKHLWTIFKPETLVYTVKLGHPRVFRIRNLAYETGMCPSLALYIHGVDYDGEKFGTLESIGRIPDFSGNMSVESLNIMPFDLHPSQESIYARLLARGRRFEQLIDQHFMNYDGVAVKFQVKEKTYERVPVTGRVMIDCKTYYRLNANEAHSVNELARSKEAKRQREIYRLNQGDSYSAPQSDTTVKASAVKDTLLEVDCVLANPAVRGFSFNHKRFLEFFVDDLAPVEWNASCFDQLVLEPTAKRTVQALVSSHATASSVDHEKNDDIVKGKGQGVVMVLHGPPGVGKTLTAECVAEWVRRPLYTVSSGDLGTTSSSLDAALTRIMDMTSTWRAVLLIDEADVFLERRTPQDLKRNAIVSVFLRVLEYYRGILFLTTNRVGTFDDAFKSRIHVPLRYLPLDEAARRGVWQNFCAHDREADLDGAALDRLARHPLNGRQIKNVVKAARSMAAFDGKPLDMARLEEVTEIHAKFERDLGEVMGSAGGDSSV